LVAEADGNRETEVSTMMAHCVGVNWNGEAGRED